MEDLRCPNGCGMLEKMQTPLGMMWECGSCKGRSMGVAVLKKSAAPKAVNVLWGLARDGHSTRGVPCLHCSQSSARVSVPLRELASKMKPAYLAGQPEDTAIAEPGAEDPTLTVDLCQRCYVLWLETKQLAQLPTRPKVEVIEEKELPEEAKQAMAIMLANQAARRTAGALSSHDGHVTSMWMDVDHVANGLLDVLFWGLDF